MGPALSFLDGLKLTADRAAAAESDFRREIAERGKALESERVVAFRRLNLMRAIAEAIAGAESEEIAVAVAAAVLRAKLGWSSDSDARMAVVSRFASVTKVMFGGLAHFDNEDTPEPDIIKALAEFETWYAETHPSPFWILFENYMPETPVVDF
jgi:hypothetical protein